MILLRKIWSVPNGRNRITKAGSHGAYGKNTDFPRGRDSPMEGCLGGEAGLTPGADHRGPRMLPRSLGGRSE